MVRQTRASAKTEPEVDEEMDTVDIDVPRKAGPPASDASYERKFVIARGQRLVAFISPARRSSND